MDEGRRQALRALGMAVKAAREQRQISGPQLATWIDVTPQAIDALECGEQSPDPALLLRLSFALGVTPKAMFSRYAEHDARVARLVKDSDMLCSLFAAALDRARK